MLLTALRSRLMADKKLTKMAQTSDPQIFVESIFPKAFGAAAQDSYLESQVPTPLSLRISTSTMPL